MILINELYQDVRAIVNPYQSGYFDDMFTSYANAASREYFNYLIDILKGYEDAAQQTSATEPETMLRVTDMLHPFIKRVVINVDSTGKMLRPENYGYYADMRIRHDQGALYQCLCKGENGLDCPEFPSDPTAPTIDEKIRDIINKPATQYRVEILDLKQYTDRTASHIYKPSARFPVCYPFAEEGESANDVKMYWQLDPVNIGSAMLLYYRQPRDAKYETEVDLTTGDNVFDETNSSNLEWDKKLQPKLAQKIATLYAQFISKENLYATSTDQTNKPI